MESIRYHTLVCNDDDGIEQVPLFFTEDRQAVSDRHDLYLTKEHSRDEHGRVHRQYRLHARHPHTIEMALDYTIQCPRCKVHNLKQVGRCLDSHTLGAYIYPVCDKH